MALFPAATGSDYVLLLTARDCPHGGPARSAAPAQYARLAMGAAITQMLRIAARLKLADQIGDVPKTAAELAEANDVNADALYRMLRALAAKVFAEREDGAFEMTDLAQFLRSNAMGPIARRWVPTGTTRRGAGSSTRSRPANRRSRSSTASTTSPTCPSTRTRRRSSTRR